MPKPYDLTSYDGKRVDWLTRTALEHTAARLGYPLTILQGSYRAKDGGGATASAGTHDAGGVVDLAPYDWRRKVRELRRTGFAAWHRPAIPGLWGEHIHAVLIGNRKLAPAAAAQVEDYLAGRNGLAGHGRDDGPRRFVSHRWRWSQRGGRLTRGKAVDQALAALRAATGKGQRRQAIDAALAAVRRVPAWRTRP